jgi:hypothetical protein
MKLFVMKSFIGLKHRNLGQHLKSIVGRFVITNLEL